MQNRGSILGTSQPMSCFPQTRSRSKAQTQGVIENNTFSEQQVNMSFPVVDEATKFSGKDKEDVKKWLEKYQSWCQVNKQKEEDLPKVAARFFNNTAEIWLSGQPKDQHYDQFLENLNSRFEGHDAASSLYNLCQTGDQTAAQFIDLVRAKALRAGHEDNRTLVSLVRAKMDPVVNQNLWGKDPENLNDLQKSVLKFERSREQNTTHTNVNMVHPQHVSDNKLHEDMNYHFKQMSEQLNSKFENLSVHIGTMKSQVGSLEAAVHKLDLDNKDIRKEMAKNQGYSRDQHQVGLYNNYGNNRGKNRGKGGRYNGRNNYQDQGRNNYQNQGRNQHREQNNGQYGQINNGRYNQYSQ